MLPLFQRPRGSCDQQQNVDTQAHTCELSAQAQDSITDDGVQFERSQSHLFSTMILRRRTASTIEKR